MDNKNGLITGVVMVIIFIGGFTLGYTVAPSSTADEEKGMLDTLLDRDAATSESQAVAESAVNPGSEAGTTLDASAMTAGQRKLLESLGVEADSITLTPETIACAKAKLGTDRVTAIQNGDTPSFIEGTKLMACYSAG